jgi:hypothetical protein
MLYFLIKERVLVVFKINFCNTVMVMSLISCKGDVMPIHIFNKRLVVFLKENIVVFREFVHFLPPWIGRVTDGRHYVHVHSWAHKHSSRETHAWYLVSLLDL